MDMAPASEVGDYGLDPSTSWGIVKGLSISVQTLVKCPLFFIKKKKVLPGGVFIFIFHIYHFLF